ncbi:MAG TPA: hemerythrin domain-containing protein [Herbaspirillum sp.]|jgi:hemerythrin superfamily protein
MTTTITHDAIELLKSDHREAEDFFKQYEELKDAGKMQEKLAVAKQVCGALLIHMEIEEKMFYPRVREATGEEDLVNEAVVEHAGAKDLIKQLATIKPEDPMFDAKIKVLSEEIEHHVKEEEKEMFPKTRKTDIDLDALGNDLFEAKNKLRAEHGLPPV